MPETGAKIAVQGKGNVGGVSAKLLYDLGHKIVAISGAAEGIYKAEGLNIPALLAHLESHKGKFEGYNEDGASPITNEELITCDCDVLIPCALENQITGENAGNIKAKLISEGANGPTSVEADEILNAKGVIVMPDILANAGGVIVSYFEWVQNIQELTWEESQVNETLRKIIVRSFGQVRDIVKKHGVSFRLAAYMLAVSKLVAAKKIRGIFP
jgi:glutamate dehydrogenase (NAD(P)+)